MKKNILFLCTHNSCRSQMAEGFLKALYGEKYEVYSAGTESSSLNPYAIKVMKEVGIDISDFISKSINELPSLKFDHVVTVCDNAKKTCPIFPGKYKKIHWDIEDPAEAQGNEEEKLIIFRKVRDDIKKNILSVFKVF